MNDTYYASNNTEDNDNHSVKNGIDKEEYERDLKTKQEEHLKSIKRNAVWHSMWRPCLHDQCPECVGTGLKRDGSFCFHNISCPCPRCTPQTVC